MRWMLLLGSALLLVMIMGTTSAAAQETSALAVEDIVYIRDIIDARYPEMVTLAPDGSALAYFGDDGLCLYTPESGETTCVSLPESFQRPGSGLTWSPNSRYIAFIEDYSRSYSDSDVWVMDVAAGTITDLTDDGYAGDILNTESPMPVDYLPFWGSNGLLYFLRAMTGDSMSRAEVVVSRIDPAGGEAEAVSALHGLTFSDLYESRSWRGLSGTVALSPDGSLLAVNVMSPEDAANPFNGLWLFDLTGAQEPRQLISLLDLQTVGMPAYRVSTYTPVTVFIPGLAWLPQGTGLLLSGNDLVYGTLPPATLTYFIDIESGDITPLMDFSAMDVVEDDFLTAGGGRLDPEGSLLFDVPRAAVVSPDGSSAYLLHFSMDAIGLSMLPLPPQPGTLPTLFFRSEELSGPPLFTRSTASADGRYLLLGGYLFTLEEG